MNKKVKVSIIAVVCVAVIVFIGGVLFKTSGVGTGNQTSSYEGTWKVATVNSEIKENAYFVISETDVKIYSGDVSEPLLTSKYEINKEGKIKLTDSDMQFRVGMLTINNVVFVEEKTEDVYVLFKYEGEMNVPLEIDTSVVEGEWNVIIHGGSLASEETMSFENGKFVDVLNGDVYFEGSYSWTEEKNLSIDGAGLLYKVYPVSDDTLMLLDLNDGYVWELQKAAE